jgi:hypothetical protein
MSQSIVHSFEEWKAVIEELNAETEWSLDLVFDKRFESKNLFMTFPTGIHQDVPFNAVSRMTFSYEEAVEFAMKENHILYYMYKTKMINPVSLQAEETYVVRGYFPNV